MTQQERKVGETFNHGPTLLKVVASTDSCDGCFYYGQCPHDLLCCNTQRQDDQYIIFQPVTKQSVGDKLTFDGVALEAVEPETPAACKGCYFRSRSVLHGCQSMYCNEVENGVLTHYVIFKERVTPQPGGQA